MRVFAAIEIDTASRSALAALAGRLGALTKDVGWVRAENYHLTLRFLGAVDPAQVEGFAAALRDGLGALAAFDARLRGVGAFPSARRASVIWSAMEGERGSLHSIYVAAESAARAIGLPADSRAFVPHVTLGRVRAQGGTLDVTDAIAGESGFSSGAFAVEAVSLFSSELTPQGARYTRLHRLTLDGNRRATPI